MKRKKLISIVLAVLIIGTAFILPISVNALSKSSTDIDITWEKGRYNANNGATEGESYGYCIRANTYIDVSSYNQISINYSGNYQYNVHFYNDDYSFKSSSNGQFAYATSPGTVDVDGTYMTISIYKNPVTVSEGSNITVIGLKNLDNSIIDGSQTASLTIHKYEMEDTSTAEQEGTGYNTDASFIPDDAKPLASVSFKITKIKDWSSTSQYITTIYENTPIPTPAEAVELIAEMEENGENPFTRTKTTDNNGTASFTDLPLGIYFVQETSSPSHVVGAVKDFVVTLPITNTEGNGWKYDVDVYPKNETRYQEITLEKTDYDTGKGIENAVFSLQRSTNGGGTWNDVETGLTTDKYGTVSPPDALPVKGMYRFLETTAADDYILDNSSRTSYNFFIDEEGNICDTTSSHNIIDESNPHRVQMTNSKPTIEKFIDKSKGENSNLVKSSAITREGNIYDWFSIKVHTPNVTMSNIRTFTVTDEVMGYDFNGRPYVSKVVKEDGTELATSSYTQTYTPSRVTSYSDKYSLTVEFTPSNLEKNTDYYILVHTQVGARNVSNTAKLRYSTNTTGTETTNEITSDEVNLYYFGYKLKKIDGTTGNALSGAEFKLYNTKEDAENGTNALQTVTTGTNGIATFSYINVGDTDKDETELQDSIEWEQGYISGTTGATGNNTTDIRTQFIDISNYSSLTYVGERMTQRFFWYDNDKNFISATSNATSNNRTVTIPNEAVYAKMSLYDSNGLTIDDASKLNQLIGTVITQGTYYVVETKAPKVTNNGSTIEYSLLSEPFEITVTNDSINVSEQDMTFVKNYQKIEFPMTGGFGIVLLITVGTFIIAMASIIYFKKKKSIKMKEEK